MSRKDDIALDPQGVSKTTDAGLCRGITHHEGCSCHETRWQDRLDQAIKERDAARANKHVMRRDNERLRQTLRRLIALHERELETGQPISGEEWEVAGDVILNKHEPS